MSGTSEQTEQHTVIHSECQECPDADTVSILEHPRDSPQHDAVSDAVHTVAEEHADETGHHVQVGDTEAEPDAARRLARDLAQSFSGVEDDAFDEELIA